MLTFDTIILRIIEELLERIILCVYKFSRDVILAYNRNPGFSRFYFWESFVIATWYYAF